MRTSIAALMVATAVASCAAEDELADMADPALDGKADGPLDSAWTTVGTGVAYQQVNTGGAILIAYGGYSARTSDSAAWAMELVDQKLGAYDVGHIYAVKGPADPGYNAREIGNSKLRAHLRTFDDGTSPIYVVAHSSGSYVAHELLAQLASAGTTNVLGRIHYANLDGGGSGLTSSIVSSLADIEFVYARDPSLASGLSKNSGTAMVLGMTYGRVFEVRVPNSGCASGAGWCLHDVVITHRPHNAQTFDLARDYTDFTGRPVTTEYLDPFLPAD